MFCLADESLFYKSFSELVIESAIQEALKDASKKDIKGKEVTPFVLAAVARATEGASLDASILFQSIPIP